MSYFVQDHLFRDQLEALKLKKNLKRAFFSNEVSY